MNSAIRFTGCASKTGCLKLSLGAMIGVSNKAISKWETGKAKPRLEVVQRLSDILSVLIDDLLNGTACKKQISKIVITGGPCAGKTTAMS